MLDDSHAPSTGLPGPDPPSGPAPVADGPDAVARIARAHAPALRPAPARHRLLALLGPAFVAAVAYVDPGNVAANITAGARYGYALVWVLVLANVMAVLIQYQSAKLGIVTGRSLPQLLRSRLGHRSRLAFFAQAELVAVATDLAEVIGGAIALNLLVGTPLLVGGCIIGAISLLLLAVQQRRSQRTFEGLIIGLLVIVTIGFVGGLLAAPPDWGHVAHGLVPRLEGTDSLLVAASMLGATVMPHAIYLHSSLVRDHHGGTGEQAEPQSRDPAAGAAQAGSRDGVGKRRARIARLVRATRVDVVWALGLAGMVNIALLLLAASALSGAEGTDTIDGRGGGSRLRRRTPGLGTRLNVGGRLRRSRDHGRSAARAHSNSPAAAAHPHSGAAHPGGGHRTHLGPRRQPGRAVLRHPLRTRAAGGTDRVAPGHGPVARRRRTALDQPRLRRTHHRAQSGPHLADADGTRLKAAQQQRGLPVLGPGLAPGPLRIRSADRAMVQFRLGPR